MDPVLMASLIQSFGQPKAAEWLANQKVIPASQEPIATKMVADPKLWQDLTVALASAYARAATPAA